MAKFKSALVILTIATSLSGCMQAKPEIASIKVPQATEVFDAHYHAAWQASDDAAWLQARIVEMDTHGISQSVLSITSEDDLNF